MARKKKTKAKKSKKKTLKRKTKKRSRAGKLKGNYRMPTLAAAKRYVKQHAKFSSEKKAKPEVKIRFDEARSILRRATGKSKSKLSKKKGRGNFKFTTPAKAKAYIRQVSAKQAASKLRRPPFAARVRECVLILGREEVDALIAKGQEARLRAEQRKTDAAAKKKRARKKRLQAQAKKLLAEISKIEKSLNMSKTRYASKLKAIRAKYDSAKRKAAAARKKRSRKRK